MQGNRVRFSGMALYTYGRFIATGPAGSTSVGSAGSASARRRRGGRMAKRRGLPIEGQAGGGAFAPPYPPSWFDRFTAWVDRLRGPAWAFYLILALAVVLVETAIQWRERSPSAPSASCRCGTSAISPTSSASRTTSIRPPPLPWPLSAPSSQQRGKVAHHPPRTSPSSPSFPTG